MKYLNLGCGSHFHPDWINIDFSSSDKNVIAYNLLNGIPFTDNSVDVVYHSHVLEHFSYQDAKLFIKECFRVLKSGGVIRVAAPDLEQIAILYLKSLNNAVKKSELWKQNYQWMMLEMYDQTVRNESGGEMLKYFIKDNLQNKDFIVKRCGVFINDLIEIGKQRYLSYQKDLEKKETLQFNYILNMLRKIKNFLLNNKYRKETFLKFILKNDYKALEIGRFRLGGEIHQWMYDRYSLHELLKECGFSKIVQRTADTSYIKNWNKFELDADKNLNIYKTDSIYFEAIK